MKARWLTQFPDWRIVSAGDGAESGPFNVAAALNRCVDESTANVLYVTGADAVLRPDKILEAVKHAEAGRWCMGADTLWRCDRLDTESILAREPDAVLAHIGRRRVCQLGWGPICGPREVLLQRFWDERFTAGGEDDAVGLALETIVGPPARVTQSPCVLLFHPSPKRADHPDRDDCVKLLARYKHARWQQREMWSITREWQ